MTFESCAESFRGLILRSMGREFGDRLLPRGLEIDTCDQVFLIASGLVWNVYFATLALFFGFFLATAVALGKASPRAWARKPAEAFVFLFRGSPLFVQFFFIYEALVLLPREGITLAGITLDTQWTTRAWAGALFVLFLNTSAYTAEIFHGALKAIPKGDLEAADAYGLTGFAKFRRVVWPTMLRLAWPSYTNEAIFLLHATTLVFFSAFPAWQQMGDALYYANYFAAQTFNPFIAYPLVGLYFILMTLAVIGLFGAVNRRLNRHLPREARARFRFRPQYIR
ncbi:ABC transporter permease [Pararhodobacter aggregans]|uniref:Amino acid ABC transporter permease n=1 Tax=Pararhodobacter aggregans TaxID=404875 RepID=A0A2T7UN02_9RHOB|nr:ABC transporter permease subunit [Pararhodobacter aggregans]PTX02434.1 amino acid ABC transporter membrane protein 2 (PAAT family) [Pararhodobacter aggregans]PVE46046.1 amino acid ABC transporter permease [Pararhodobacter aggregans]